ncbi:hypothetical protein XM38_004920 [Halomicronema hongdechloris C2206]|uniref:DUF2325 domain-containing protein n=1 Tax=Halomicronema hongdechloris C2206 TaxID=1641165 RepID=A0A1Z3HH14_9CYAN|nr:hypothetical protein [Halomicronema hongdechloris]ASC69565.1 hypothetical protein XM38_004920 [Halomicronema hongdechloris C2206]
MHDLRGFRRLLMALYRQPWLWMRGISGADRREKRRLMRRLSTLKAECNVLRQEQEAIHHQLSLENRGLRTLYEDMKAERDDLQLEIWELEDLVEELFQLLTAVEAWQPTAESEPLAEIPFGPQTRVEDQPLDHQTDVSTQKSQANLQAIDVSGIKLALVGGHDATRRGVIDELTRQHGLAKWVELPPFSKHSLGRSNIKAKIHDCDLVVLITGYMKHKQTDSIMQLRKVECLSGDVLLLNCRGKSGVVREILAYISQKNCKV